MKIGTVVIYSSLALCIGSCLTLFPRLAAGAANLPLPTVIEAGFNLWAKGSGADTVLGSWQRGGLMEGSNKASTQAGYLRSLSRGLGNYKSYELIQTKGIGRAAQIFYLSVYFERGAVFGRFLMYRTEKDWVVQNMDFSDRPEAIMPWLALEGDKTLE
jgi:hypothetical protein